MPRKGNVPKREVLPDPVYGSKVVTKLINNLMIDGKKGKSQKIVYDAFEMIAEKTGENALEIFETAMENIMPVLEVKARRVGGANYQVPVEVRPERRQTLGLRWLVNYTRARGEKGMVEKLAKEKWMLLTIQELLLRRKKILIRWQKLIKHLLTIDSNNRIDLISYY
ncbi:ribosomal protein S7 [[Clostridium] sordellii ATCC 9714]|nr:ribosomal protein S7 [[Clostridium] sordellii ATCC 9714] [Paeniclostridium sordellii ATCC 9714]